MSAHVYSIADRQPQARVGDPPSLPAEPVPSMAGQARPRPLSAQVRVPMVDPLDAERRLTILAARVERALVLLRANRKREDPALLDAVRGVLADANHLINAKARG